MAALSEMGPANLAENVGELVWLESERFLLAVAPRVGGRIAGFWLGTRSGWRAVIRPLFQDKFSRRLLAGCFPLVPYANRIANGAFRFAGLTYKIQPNPVTMPHSLHGVGWEAAWKIQARDSLSITLSLSHPRSSSLWPWAFEATQRFELTDDGLKCVLAFRNTTRNEQPCALGFHPAFVHTSATRIKLNAHAYRSSNDCGVPTRFIAIKGTPFDYSQARFLPDRTVDVTFEGWDGNAHILDGDDNALTITSNDVNRAVLFAPVNQDFLCIEPVQNATNALNAKDHCAFGIHVLPPEGKNVLAMQIFSDVTRRP